MQKNDPQFFIGCSGYYYPRWKGGFYPTDIPTSRWLQHYSSIFNTVEMNATFYRMARLSDLKRYAKVVPDDFGFSVKMSRYITHTLKMKDAALPIQEFSDLLSSGLGQKLKVFLFQFPASFQFSEENLENILENIPPRMPAVMEFRHLSWWNKAVWKKLKAKGITFCNVDYPGIQQPLVDSGKRCYLRLHGTPELFKSSYTEEQLRHFFDSLPKANEYYVYFNNTYFEAAPGNAMKFKAMAG